MTGCREDAFTPAGDRWRAFHRSHPEVPVVMVTAYWSDHLDAEIERRGDPTLQRKPVDYEELARLLPVRA